MKRTVLFEGAGMDYTNENSNIGNYRIRTAFTNDEGRQVYLEIEGHEFTEGKGKKEVKTWRTHFAHVHYITGSNEDCNKNRIDVDWQEIRENCKYNKTDLIKYINKICKTSFEDMEVLNDFEGYRVHGNYNEYNFMEDHQINRARTEAREKACNEADALYRAKTENKYSVISVMNMNDSSITIRSHASDEALRKSGLDREVTIAINY